MRFLPVSFLASLVLILGACATEPNAGTGPSVNFEKCLFDDGKTEAPAYFCTRKIEGYSVLGRGVYGKSAAGMNFMVQQAALAARLELAQGIRTQIMASVKQYLSTTGKNDSASIDVAASSSSKSLTDESLMNSVIVRQVVGPDGEVYVFVGVNEKQLREKKQAAILDSMNSDQAAWGQFSDEKSNEDRANDIASINDSAE